MYSNRSINEETCTKNAEKNEGEWLISTVELFPAVINHFWLCMHTLLLTAVEITYLFVVASSKSNLKQFLNYACTIESKSQCFLIKFYTSLAEWSAHYTQYTRDA